MDRSDIELIGQYILKCGFHRRNRESIACKSTADPANVRVIDVKARRELLGNFLGKAVYRRGHSSSEGLADREEIRLKAEGSSISAGTRANGVGLIKDEVRSIFAGDFTERIMIAGVRMNNADVRQHRLCKDCRHVACRECSFKR